MHDENRAMSECQKYICLQNAYIDNELSAEEAEAFEFHAAHCESCAKTLSMALMIRDCALGMDDDITVPLAAQSAWRRAVRTEIAGKKRRRFVKAASGIAAALVLLVGSTFALRNTDLLYPPQNETGARTFASIQNDELLIAPLSADNGFAAPVSRDAGYMTRTANMLQSDSSLDEPDTSAEVAAMTEEALADKQSTEIRIASREASSDSFDGDRQSLYDLVSEYGGSISSDSVDYQSGVRVGQYTIRVYNDYLDDFLVAFENIGKTVSFSLKNDDIGAHYYDANSRLDTANAMVARLNELIAQADADSISDLKASLDAAYSEIDELERILSAYNTDNISNATVYFTLHEVSKLPQTTPEPSIGERSSSGFNQSLNAIGDFFGDMVVSMAVIAPVAGSILIGVAIVFCIAYYIGKKKSKQNVSNEKKE